MFKLKFFFYLYQKLLHFIVGLLLNICTFIENYKLINGFSFLVITFYEFSYNYTYKLLLGIFFLGYVTSKFILFLVIILFYTTY